jgi:ABC-type nitrate/sulfonate/bicarbonate transport system permease component
VAGVIALWQLATAWSGIAPTILPSPARVVGAGWGDRAALGAAAGVSLRETAAGLALAVLISAVIAVGIESSRFMRHSVYPLLIGSQTVPVVAIAPLVVIWFGFGEGAKVALVALYAFFPIVVGLVGGMEATPREQVDLLKTIGLRPARVLLGVKLPSALPQFFAGLRIAATYALGTAVIAEFLGSFNGLGIYLIGAKSSFRTDLVFAGAAVTVLLTLALYGACAAIEHLTLPWRRAARKDVRP